MLYMCVGEVCVQYLNVDVLILSRYSQFQWPIFCPLNSPCSGEEMPTPVCFKARGFVLHFYLFSKQLKLRISGFLINILTPYSVKIIWIECGLIETYKSLVQYIVYIVYLNFTETCKCFLFSTDVQVLVIEDLYFKSNLKYCQLFQKGWKTLLQFL